MSYHPSRRSPHRSIEPVAAGWQLVTAALLAIA